jgi:DNA-binding transcriptional MerR regulator
LTTHSWKIGDLAKRTHLSVRTLHYYEEVGLLRPSARTEAGHRLYTEDDVVRLQRILSLRQLGFTLEDIRRCLDQDDYALAPLIDLQLERLREQIALQQGLYQRLSRLRARLHDGENVPVTQFIETMEAMMQIEQYLTPEQIATLEAAHGEHREANVAAFKAFVDQLRTHQQAGREPGDPAVQAMLAQRRALVADTTLDDPALAQGLQRMISTEPEIRQRFGLDDALLAYLSEAVAIGGSC